MAKMKICIDAGHYGKYNRSPVVPEYYESDMVWKLHMMQKEILEGYGFDVVLTRSNQATDRGLYDRGYAAKGCVLFMSDHSNACGTESVDYPVVYRAYDNAGNCDELALKLAKTIASVMGTTQAGRTATRKNSSGGEYYGVLRGARAAGLTHYYIIEHSFHTNKKATQWLLKDENLRKLAEAECRDIAEYFGVSKEKDKGDMTKITGKAEATAEQMTAYIKSKNPDVAQSVIDMIPLYLSEGAIENIRGDIAFAQSCLETGNFAFKGSAVTLDQNNFCGMGVTENGMKGNSFDTPQLGIRAQIQHLKAYANTAALKQECIDPRFKYVKRGSAAYVEYLGIQENPKKVGWAAGAGYGEKILNILKSILATGSSSGSGTGGNAGGSTAGSQGGNTSFPALPFSVRVKISDLNIRTSPSSKDDSNLTGQYTGVGTFTIVELSGSWGKMKSGAGWIYLGNASYCSIGDTVKEEPGKSNTASSSSVPYMIVTTCDILRIRKENNDNCQITGRIVEKEGHKKKYTIVEEKGGWGRLKSGAGWICLKYTKKVS